MADALTFATLSGQSSPEPQAQVSPVHLIGLTMAAWRCELGLKRSQLDRLVYGPGDLFVSRRNVEEWIRWTAAGKMFLVGISDAVFDEVAHEVHRASVPSINATAHLDDSRVQSLMYALHAERESGFTAGRLFLDTLSRSLATLLLTSRGGLRQARNTRGGLMPRHLRRVLEYIEAHLDRNLSLHELAQLTSLSPAHFAQMFRVSTGEPPHRFLLRRRMERAKHLLVQTDECILDIALQTGFRSQQHFARVFRSLCRLSPSEFRHR